MNLPPAAIILGLLQDLRDVVIIIWGILGIIFFAAGIVLFYVVYRLLRGAAGMATDIVEENVKPLLTTVQSTVQSARGTTAYIGDRLVDPIIRITAFVAGVRRGFSVLVGIVRRGQRLS